MEVKIRFHKSGYFIRIERGDLVIAVQDMDMAELIGMEASTYKKILLEKFNGVNKDQGIFFNNKEDIEKAIEWLEPQIIIAKLRGGL